jgi:hypothetical protein
MEILDWGHVTPESANMENNEFTYVYNHDISSPEKINRTIRFIVGRLAYYDKHLPANPKHLVKIDVRGQDISEATEEKIKTEIHSRYTSSNILIINIVR